MSARARAPRKLPRCRECHRTVVFFRSASTGLWRPFDPSPVDPRNRTSPAPAYPVEGSRAWQPQQLIEELMVRHGTTRADAEAEAFDMPWHAVHVCPSTPTDPEDL